MRSAEHVRDRHGAVSTASIAIPGAARIDQPGAARARHRRRRAADHGDRPAVCRGADGTAPVSDGGRRRPRHGRQQGERRTRSPATHARSSRPAARSVWDASGDRARTTRRSTRTSTSTSRRSSCARTSTRRCRRSTSRSPRTSTSRRTATRSSTATAINFFHASRDVREHRPRSRTSCSTSSATAFTPPRSSTASARSTAR